MAYFVGGCIFFTLASIDMHYSATGAEGYALTWRVIISYFASCLFFVGGVAFTGLALNQRHHRALVTRERDLQFYSQMVKAGQKHAEANGDKMAIPSSREASKDIKGGLFKTPVLPFARKSSSEVLDGGENDKNIKNSPTKSHGGKSPVSGSPSKKGVSPKKMSPKKGVEGDNEKRMLSSLEQNDAAGGGDGGGGDGGGDGGGMG